jgi:hypothetical protein
MAGWLRRPADQLRRSRICAKSAQKSANPDQTGQTRCQSAGQCRFMAKIIPVRFRRSRLPRRLLNDGWWLEAPPARSFVIAFPKRNEAPRPGAAPTRRVRHLTLITNPGK